MGLTFRGGPISFEQRIVITGDADFMSGGDARNNSIGTGLYSWLMKNEYPVYTRVVIPEDRMVKIGRHAGKVIWYV